MCRVRDRRFDVESDQRQFRALFLSLRAHVVQPVFEVCIGAQSGAVWGTRVLIDQVRDHGVGGAGARSIGRQCNVGLQRVRAGCEVGVDLTETVGIVPEDVERPWVRPIERSCLRARRRYAIECEFRVVKEWVGDTQAGRACIARDAGDLASVTAANAGYLRAWAGCSAYAPTQGVRGLAFARTVG